MGKILSKKDSNPSEPPTTFVSADTGFSSTPSQKKGLFPNPFGKKVGVDAGQSTGQLSTFLDSNGSILTKSNNTEFGSSFFQYTDSIAAPAEADKRVKISPVNFA